MNHLLIATKCSVPTIPPHAVDRPQLYQRLHHSIQSGQRLVLVSAPAGFGKSTLVSSWIKHCPHPPVAWLSLDADDNYPEMFLQYLLAAITEALPTAALPVFVPSWSELTDSTLRLMLAPLVNTFAQQALPLVIVLDDYHVITNQLVHNILTFLLKYLPACVQLVIASRTDPSLPLASLRARQQLSEIRTGDLRFNQDEIRRFFHERWPLLLAEDVLQTITSSTEGWAVGLQLAALVMSDQSPAGAQDVLTAFDNTNRFILDYLAEEVFYHLPTPTQQFLLRTSILDRLTDEVCQILMEDVVDAPRLGDVLRRNLFLTQLGDQSWYRYHHLFVQFLRAQLRQTATHAEIVTLHIRASRWFQQRGFRREAIDYTVRAAAWSEMLQLLTPAPPMPELLADRSTWQHWLDALPTQVINTRSDLCLLKAWLAAFGDDIDTAAAVLDNNKLTFPMMSQGSVHALRAYIALFRGQHIQRVKEATRALELLSDQQEPLLWAFAANLSNKKEAYESLHAAPATLTHAWHLGVLLNEPNIMVLSADSLSEIELLGGRLRNAANWLNMVREHINLSYTIGGPYWHSIAARIAYEHNDLAQAEQIVRQGFKHVDVTGLRHNLVILNLVLVRTQRALGNGDDSGLLLLQYKLAVQHGRLREAGEIHALQIQTYLIRGELVYAAHWCDTYALDLQAAATYDYHGWLVAHAYLARTYAREQGHTSRVAAVELALTSALATSAEAGRMGDHIQLLTVHALLAWALGRADEAAASLGTALALGEPEGYLRTFLDEGPALLPLLAHPTVAQAAPVLVAQLHVLLAPQVAGMPFPTPQSEMLSLREQEILRLAADGYSVQKIATQLVISIHTARTHLKNIYAKLDAHTRFQAVEQARKHGLL